MSMENSQYSAAQILEALRSGDNDNARSAAFSCGRLWAWKRLCLCSANESKAKTSACRKLRNTACAKYAGRQAIEALLPLLRSDEAPVRNVAMDILREIGVDSIESMQPYLRDDDPDLRIFIADILGYCRSHQSALLLGDALLKDPEVNVRYQAAVSLGNLAFPESVGDLCQAMHDEEWVQFAVVEALAKNQGSVSHQRSGATAAAIFHAGQLGHH